MKLLRPVRGCVHLAEYKQHLALESAHIVLGKRLASHHSGENAHNIRLVKILGIKFFYSMVAEAASVALKEIVAALQCLA